MPVQRSGTDGGHPHHDERIRGAWFSGKRAGLATQLPWQRSSRVDQELDFMSLKRASVPSRTSFSGRKGWTSAEEHRPKVVLISHNNTPIPDHNRAKCCVGVTLKLQVSCHMLAERGSALELVQPRRQQPSGTAAQPAQWLAAQKGRTWRTRPCRRRRSSSSGRS